MAPTTDFTVLKGELRSIERLIEELLQRQSELCSRLAILEAPGAWRSSAAAAAAAAPGDVPAMSADPGAPSASGPLSSPWMSVDRPRMRVSLPLYASDAEDDDGLVPLSNFFAPLAELTLPATCSNTKPELPVALPPRSGKRRTPPTTPSMFRKRARCSSPPPITDADSWPPLPAPQSSLPPAFVETVTVAMSDDVICSGDPNSSSTTLDDVVITDEVVIADVSLSPRLSVYDKGCKDQPPEILVIGDSIIRNVHLPGSITYCLSGGKTTDFIELIPSIIDLHPSVHHVLLHVGTNDVMARQSVKLHHDLESLVSTVESLGKICVLSGPIPTLSKSSERFSRLYSLHHWMRNFATATGLGFISNFDYFWTERDLFKPDGLHVNKKGSEKLTRNFINFIAFGSQ